jgi:hypothetical protein
MVQPLSLRDLENRLAELQYQYEQARQRKHHYERIGNRDKAEDYDYEMHLLHGAMSSIRQLMEERARENAERRRYSRK